MENIEDYIAGKKSKLIRLSLIVVLSCIGILYGLSGITDIEPGEVGLKVQKIGLERGIDKHTLDTGIHWIEPFTNDVAIYDTRLKQYDLPDVPAQTKDGQPILVDMSVEIGLIDEHVPTLHETIGSNYYHQVVYPALRAALRNSTTRKMSDEIYTGVGRVFIQNSMEKTLRDKLKPKGIHIALNLRDISFQNQDFVKTIELKAKASQQVVIETRRAEAAVQAAIKVKNVAEGEKQKRIKAAEANAEEQRLEGVGRRAQKEQDAKGILAIAKAEAEGVRLRREALSGAGGAELVSIEWAKNLGPNVKVYGIPTGSPGTSALMDLNGLLGGAFKGAMPK